MKLMRLVTGVSVGALFASSLPLAGPAWAAAPSPNRVVAVAYNGDAGAIPGAQVFGDTPPSTPETVSFVLKEQGMAQLEAAVLAGVRNYLSVSQFAQHYGQSPANISALQKYLSQFGITTQVYPDNVDVVANGTAGQFDSALSVQQQQYYAPARPGPNGQRGIPAQWFHGIDTAPQLPYYLAQFVTAILGLTNYSAALTNTAHSLYAAPAKSSSGNSSFCLSLTGLSNACNTPESFASNYDLTPLYQHGALGQGQTIGIVTLAALDVGAPEYFWSNILHLPSTGRTVTVENVDGGPGTPSDASGTGETDLDVEQSGGVAPGANVVVYQAPPTDYGFVDAYFTAASQNIASTVSASWVWGSETALQAAILTGQESTGIVNAFDEAFLEMAMQGQSAFTAAGDWAAYTANIDLGTTNLSIPFPSGSPFITSAGGTTLPWSGTLTGPSGTATVNEPIQRTWGWDYLWPAFAAVTGQTLAQTAESAVIGSGGGYSQVERMPSYQRGVAGTTFYSAVPYLTPTDYQPVDGLVEPTEWNFNPTPPVVHGLGSGRAIPDLSTDADPYSGYLLWEPSFAGVDEPILQGGWGGTSFVAPQLNGSTAVIDSYVGHRVGLWNPVLYEAAAGRHSPVTPIDISGTASDNIYYTGTPGTLYNPGSGLGYPDLAALAPYLGQMGTSH